MGRRKRTRMPKGRGSTSSVYSSASSSSSSSSLPRSPRVEIRFKRLLTERNRKSKAKKRGKPQLLNVKTLDNISETSLGRSNSINSASHYHEHYHHHHYHVDRQPHSGAASSSSSFSNRPADYDASINFQHPIRTQSTMSGDSQDPTTFYYVRSPRTPSVSSRSKHNMPQRQDTVVHNPRAILRQSSLHQSRTSQSQPYMYQPPARTKTIRTRDLPNATDSSRPIRTASRSNTSQYYNNTHKIPRRPVHTAASLENLNNMEFGSPTLMIKRKQSIASIRGSRIRRFFLRIFRRRSRVKFHYNKAQLQRNMSISVPTNDGIYKQYQVKSLQLLGLRPKPRTNSLIRRPVRGQISQPLQVTKHSGLDNTGHGEVLSIRNRQPNGQTGAIVITGSHLGNDTQVRAPSIHSSLSGNDYDTIDERLERLQQDLDETRKMKRRISSRKTSGSTSSLQRRSSRYSLTREKSFISLTSVVLPTLEDHPDIIRRSDLFKRKSLKYGLGHAQVPLSNRRISRMDEETVNEPAKVDEALAFVTTWSEYLRRAIAVRIVLRQEVRQLETQEEMEWQQLNDVQEEDEVASYNGGTDSVSSYTTNSSDSGDSEIRKTPPDLNTAGAPTFRGGQVKTTSRGPGSRTSGMSSSGSTGIAGSVRRNIPARGPVHKTSQDSSAYSTADENLVQGDIYYDRSGDVISITPISSTTPPFINTTIYADVENRTHRRTASSIRRALRQGQMHERYAALMGESDSVTSPRAAESSPIFQEKQLPALPLSQEQSTFRRNSQNSNISKASLGSFSKPGRESVWMRSSSSSGKSSVHSEPRPLPPVPNRSNMRVFSEPVRGTAVDDSDYSPTHQEGFSSSQSASPSGKSSSDSALARDTKLAGIPKLLQQQRNMSDKILAEMVQEMEELQARSMVLSDIAKNHRDVQGDSPDDEYHTPTASEGSSSELSISPVHNLKNVPFPATSRPTSHYYVLGSSQLASTSANSAAGVKSSSSSSVIRGTSNVTVTGQSYSNLISSNSNRNLHLEGVPRLHTGSDLSGGSSSSVHEEYQRTIPRKISRAESIAAAAQVNLSRGKHNRRRPRSQASSRRSSQYTGSASGGSDFGDAASEIEQHHEGFVDLTTPPSMAAAVASVASSSRGSFESTERLPTTWVSMD